eukprot:3151137-Amphidinium_carterae.2
MKRFCTMREDLSEMAADERVKSQRAPPDERSRELQQACRVPTVVPKPLFTWKTATPARRRHLRSAA